MVTGNAIDGLCIADLHCDMDRPNLHEKCSCSASKGRKQDSREAGCENHRTTNGLSIQEDDLRCLMADGTEKKKRVSRITGGGLRQFSLIVCRKVKMKGRTTYSEVADEIIAQLAAPEVNPVPLNEFDEKNIRRRVYDALNVLMALDIISKDKKEIQWKGFPKISVKDVEELQACRLKLKDRIEKKASYLHDLEEKVAGLQSLMLRNQRLHKSTANPTEGVALPFILVSTRPKATVEVEISEDMQLVHFDFNGSPFSLHDDVYVLKAMRNCQDANCGRISSNSPACYSSTHGSSDETLACTPFSWDSEFSRVGSCGCGL